MNKYEVIALILGIVSVILLLAGFAVCLYANNIAGAYMMTGSFCLYPVILIFAEKAAEL